MSNNDAYFILANAMDTLKGGNVSYTFSEDACVLKELSIDVEKFFNIHFSGTWMFNLKFVNVSSSRSDTDMHASFKAK